MNKEPTLHERHAGWLSHLPPLYDTAFHAARGVAGTANDLEDATLYRAILSYQEKAEEIEKSVQPGLFDDLPEDSTFC